jgi:hypothetical protein
MRALSPGVVEQSLREVSRQGEKLRFSCRSSRVEFQEFVSSADDERIEIIGVARRVQGTAI